MSRTDRPYKIHLRFGVTLCHRRVVACTSHASAGLTIRSAEEADWPAMALLGATCFGVWRPDEADEMWHTLMPAGGGVVACEGPDIVGMSSFLDLRLTVPGGAVLPMAGVSWVAVAPRIGGVGCCGACSPSCTLA